MLTRIKEEIDLLRKTYPELQHGENWVLIPNYRLPAGRYNLDETPVLFALPSSYPQSGPDNFFVRSSLRLKDGNTAPGFNPGAQSSSGPAPVAGDWGWFSWHPASWRPAATVTGGDNLAVFTRGVGLCLQGTETT